MSTSINTSRAKGVSVDIWDYDNIPLSIKIYDTSVDPKVVIDLTDYGFKFYLKQETQTKTTYEIAAAVMTAEFLSKTGSDNEILVMQLMWQDLRTKCQTNLKYRLVMVVTRPDESVYTYIVFNIHAKQH